MTKEVTFFFLDGVHYDLNEYKILCYGGFFNTIPIAELNKLLVNIKINLGLEEWMPVKWNFSSSVKNYYKQNWENVHPNEFEKNYNAIKEKSLEIRKELVKQASGGIKILISVFIDSKKHYRREILDWSHTNLFQRIGLNMETTTTNLLMCDFEHYKEPTRDSLVRTYFNAYYKGEKYFSGPLKRRGAFPALAFSNTLQNHMLQLADILVGCIGSLARTWISKKIPETHAKEIFEVAKESFVKHPTSGDIFRFGLITKPENFKSYLSDYGLL